VKELTDKIKASMVESMTWFAQEKMDLGLNGKAAVWETSTRNAADFYCTVPVEHLEGQKTLIYFLEKVSFTFNVHVVQDDERTHDQAAHVDFVLWQIGINFEHRGGGSNGWRAHQLRIMWSELPDKTFISIEDK
jgi:hypothetical protein